MRINEYRNIDNKLNTLINSVDKMVQLNIADTNDKEFEKHKKEITNTLKRLFSDNNLAKHYVVKFNEIIEQNCELTLVNFNKVKESLKQMIYDAIEEISLFYKRNLNFISNCSLPYCTYLRALKVYKIFSQKLIAKRKIASELLN